MTMNKKMMLLALAVASAALFALPTFASAQEIHWDTVTGFTGTGGASSLLATGEPTISCTSIDVTNGVVNAGGTTGSMTFDDTGCGAPSPFGGTVPCHTKGAPLNNTVATSGTFHMITIKTGVPGMLVTTNTTEFTCDLPGGIAFIYHITGSIIFTITSPKCAETSNKMTLSSSATGSTQNHLEYTGTKYDLISKTGAGGSGEPRTAGLNASLTLTANAAGTLTCT